METSRLRRSTRIRRKNKSPAEELSQTTISDLPEPILLHILSFLPTTDAIRTSIGVRLWRNLWNYLPNLDFDMHYFQKPIRGKSDRLARILFAEFVTQALRRRRTGYYVRFQKFKLLYFYRDYDHIRGYVDSWVRWIVQLKPVELDLDFVHYGISELKLDNDDGEEAGDTMYPYVFHISNIVSSIQVLKLSNCNLSFPREGRMELRSIKKLHLGGFPGSPHTIEQFMPLCVNLESFVLECDDLDGDLKIVSKNLKHLTLGIRNFLPGVILTVVEICTPTLESIEISKFRSGVVYNLKGVSSLVQATVIVELHDRVSTWSWQDFACWVNVVSCLTGVELMSIHNIPQDEYDLGSKRPLTYHSGECIKYLKGAKVFSEISAFHNLLYLTLRMGYMKEDILSLEVFLNKCPRLETLVLVWDFFSHRYESRTNQKRQKKKEVAGGVVALHIPRLRVVKMESYWGTKNELIVVDLLKKHGVVLEKIVAFPAKKVGQTTLPPFLL